MAVLMVPTADKTPWPTLGPALADFLEERAVHGPGDLIGQPYRLDDEKRALLYKAYEVYPKDHQWAGRRRFKNWVMSERKGSAKTEFGAALSFLELHPESPVRTDGWRKVGSTFEPVGRPVVDPFIPMVAYTEHQTDELAYRALYVMCTEGPDNYLFDAGLDRIIRLDEHGRPDGKAVSVAASPDSTDGARTTFQHFDETHRMVSARLIAAHETMQQNIPKRVMADAWTAKTTTAYEPGEGSIHENDHRIAEDISKGRKSDATFFFFHRYASDKHDLDTAAGVREAIREASGPALMSWPGADIQVEGIAGLYEQAKERGTEAYWERVWLNRPTQSGGKAFKLEQWRSLATKRIRVLETDSITIGLDGSRWRDSTGIVCTDIRRGYQWKQALWTVDDDHPEIPVSEVMAVVDELFDNYDVVRFYFDPAFGWGEGPGQTWEGKYGNRVVRFETGSRSPRKIADATEAYVTAVNTDELLHDGDEEFAEHINNAYKYVFKGRYDEEGHEIWSLGKGPGKPPPLMDLAIGGVLSWQARLDAIAAGWKPKTRAKMRIYRG